MTRFIDGPAQGQNLMLQLSPIYLRVTEENGKWDALDKLDDAPRPGERIYAYELSGEPGMCHILMRGKSGSGFYAHADYKLCAEQPSYKQARDAWPEWVQSQASKPAPAPQRFTVEKQTIDGEEVTRRVPYEEPNFPVREYVIVERATGNPILEKPGGRKMLTESKERKDGKRTTKVTGDEPQPFIALTDPRDHMHATRYSEEEAIAKARYWKLSNGDYKITKA